MELNGLKLPIAFALAALSFAGWVGTLQQRVASAESDITKHESKPAHDVVAKEQATAEAERQALKETTKKIEKRLDNIEKKMDDNQKEILRAIKEK